MADTGLIEELAWHTIWCPLQRGKLVPKFCEVIASTLTAIDVVLEKLIGVVKGLPCAPDEITDVELAVNEALANAILHGNHGDEESYCSLLLRM